jgi:death-on-curing protein
MSQAEPRGLAEPFVLALQERLLGEHGGMAGVRDAGLFKFALDRPKNQWHYGGECDLFALAAGYAHALGNNHPFIDGNKRIAFGAAAVFIQINGWRVEAAEAEVVVMTLGLADKSVSEARYAAWLRDNCVKA